MTFILSITLWAFFSILYWTLKLGISPMPTSRAVQKALVRTLPIEYFGTISDLGSGFGSMLFFFASRYPKAKIIGYEQSLFPYLISKFWISLMNKKNIQIKRADFRSEKLERGWFYIYLFSKGMRNLDTRLFEGSFVISNTFQLDLPYTKKIPSFDWHRSHLYLYNF